jgi:hypothetical protein
VAELGQQHLGHFNQVVKSAQQAQLLLVVVE